MVPHTASVNFPMPLFPPSILQSLCIFPDNGVILRTRGVALGGMWQVDVDQNLQSCIGETQEEWRRPRQDFTACPRPAMKPWVVPVFLGRACLESCVDHNGDNQCWESGHQPTAAVIVPYDQVFPSPTIQKFLCFFHPFNLYLLLIYSNPLEPMGDQLQKPCGYPNAQMFKAFIGYNICILPTHIFLYILNCLYNLFVTHCKANVTWIVEVYICSIFICDPWLVEFVHV